MKSEFKPELRVSAIVPVLDEVRTVGMIVERTLPFVDEVIVVDGGSHDGSREAAMAAGAIVVCDNGLGKGDAIRVGMSRASGKFVVTLDADGSHIPEDIPKLLKPLLKEECDLVIASRATGGSAELTGTMDRNLRRWGSAIITRGINWRFSARLTDSQNGFRAFVRDRMISLGLCENITTIEQEMLIKALAHHWRVAEVPSFEKERMYGESHIFVPRVAWRYVYSWLRELARPSGGPL